MVKRGLQGVTEGYLWLQEVTGVTMGYRRYQEVTGGYKGLHDVNEG